MRRPSIAVSIFSPNRRLFACCRWIVLAPFLVSGAAFEPQAARADLIYTIQDYPVDQANYGTPYDVTGQIVTDGTIGGLSASNILSWSITITNADTQAAVGTYSGSGAGVGVLLEGDVEATATQITIALPAEPTTDTSVANELEFHTTPQFYFVYDRNWSYNARQNLEVSDSYYQASQYITYWSQDGPQMGGNDPWVVASAIPEPSSIVLASIAAFLGIGACWRRRVKMTRADGNEDGFVGSGGR